MAKDPAFLFYTNDWLGGTMYFNLEQKGAYLSLLLLQFAEGKFTTVQAQQVLNTSYSSVWPAIASKFVTDGVYFWNEKMATVREQRKAFTDSRRKNRLKRDIPNNTSKTLVELVGNGNGNTNTVVIEVNNFLKRKGSNTMDVTYMVKQWLNDGHTDIMGQLKAMKAVYESNDWKFPTKIETLTTSFSDGDWIAQLKDLDPERKAERIQKTINDGRHVQQLDTIGSSQPGSLG